ncbi:hypothetical protein EYF80_054710 [Liparis tanakae]|uniref:Uncharacterized protein n=1 Tax=Liparis tanakae TaxID=230148 RepID=A0A4Z2F1U4_9TELE|nr:hypothetical protein EYF80_054710 [Liparis tanakae]
MDNSSSNNRFRSTIFNHVGVVRGAEQRLAPPPHCCGLHGPLGGTGSSPDTTLRVVNALTMLCLCSLLMCDLRRIVFLPPDDEVRNHSFPSNVTLGDKVGHRGEKRSGLG